MKRIELKKCVYCGKTPIWMDLPFQATIACQNSKGMCAENIVTEPDFISAINEWNERQEINAIIEAEKKQECDIDG